ncbi:MAG: serine hydrolase [Candidatus Aminicenantes bacterium]|nr:serine hydrolase [Candidatus Aminicenantes bacterium]
MSKSKAKEPISFLVHTLKLMRLRREAVILAAVILSMILLLSHRSFAQQRYPGEHWEKASRPEALGWSAEKLQLAKEHFEKIGSAAVVIVVDGLILDEWGETSRHFRSHSMRKSLLNAIFGIHVHEGHIDLETTLEELGIDDNEPLTESEKQATIRHLLKGRSGIYLPALSLGGSLDNPPRGSQAPGTFFQYNNWDFNVLGTIFEQETGTKLFEEFKRRIADPLHMEDFSLEDCIYFHGSHGDNVNTRFPAYPFRISARDLARFGLLYLRNGQWRGQQIIPAEWIRESWTPYSVYFGTKTLYGYTNWKIYLKGKLLPGGVRLEDNVYWTSGVGVHRVYVVPWANLVFVHRINSDIPLRRPDGDEVDRLLALILQAKIPDTGLALIEAAHKGDSEVVEALLDSGADINARDEQNQTALHLAAGRGHTAVVKLLLEHGADVNARNLLGRTPILVPVYRGSLDIVRALLNAGADIEARSELAGQTPLLIVSGSRAKAVEALLEEGADANAKGEAYHETALMLAAISGNKAAVKALLDKGADVKAAASNGRTAMLMAEAFGHNDVIKLLQDAGAPRETSRGLLPLEAYVPPYLVANAKRGRPLNPQAALALLNRGAVLEAEGETALLFAAMKGDVKALSALLEEGAGVNIKHKDGWSGLILAAANGHLPVVQALLEKDANVDAKENLMGQTSLIWAAKGGHTAVAKALLKAGANVNARDKFGGSALTRAASRGQSEIIKILLEEGADINARESDGDTAIIEATAESHLEIIKTLLKAGADVNNKDLDGRTLLMIAAMIGTEKVVKDLLEAGADINAKDNFGSTALKQATTLKRKKIAQLLQKKGAKN